MKFLNGNDLVEFILPRQLHQSRRVLQAGGVVPRLAIITIDPNLASQKYVEYKQRYAQDIEVEILPISSGVDTLQEDIQACNNDDSVHGIIVQLPVGVKNIDTFLDMIAPQKDVDGLGKEAHYDAATATAIQWLLAGYNIELRDRNMVILGQGKLVGAPLAKMWQRSGYRFMTLQEGDDLTQLRRADIIISATGVPGILTSELVSIGALVVDAGTTEVNGGLAGDASPELYQRDDLTITPKTGGVGPLTIAALFDNVLRAAEQTTKHS